MATITDFRSLCTGFESVTEEPHFHKTSFRIHDKIFATLDESTGIAVVKLTEVDQSVFCAVDKTIVYPVAGKWGLQGWTNIDLQKTKKPLLKEILLTAYNTVASTKKKKA